MFEFTIITMLRRKVACILLAVLALCGTLGLLVLSGFLESEQAALTYAYENTVIDGTLCNLRGNMRNSLKIPERLYKLFFTPELSALVDDVSLYTETPLYSGHPFLERFSPVDDNHGETAPQAIVSDYISISGITQPQSVSTLSAINGVQIGYFDGYDETIFESESDACIVPTTLLDFIVEREDGSYMLTVITEMEQEIEDPYTGEVFHEFKRYTKELMVVGEFSSNSSKYIYMPFMAYNNWLLKEEEEFSIGMRDAKSGVTESLEFTVRDNYRIPELKAALLKNFSEPSLNADNVSDRFAFKLYDDIFNESVAKISQNISMLKVIIPVMYAVSGAVGFLVSFLFMRVRKKEFAVARSLGFKRYIVTLHTFFEQLILAVLGGGCGFVCFMLNDITGNEIDGLIFLASYMTGALISTIWITNVKVINLLKSED